MTRRRKKKSLPPKPKRSFAPLYVAAVVITVIILLLVFVHPMEVPLRSVTEICIAGETYHIHALLRFAVSTFTGSSLVYDAPANVGIIPYYFPDGRACLRPLHTHAADGIIHVEYEQQRDFTLQEFFQIWNVTFTQNRVWTWSVGESNGNGHNYTKIEFIAGMSPPLMPFDPGVPLVLRDGMYVNVVIS